MRRRPDQLLESLERRIRFQWLVLVTILVGAPWVTFAWARELLDASTWQFWMALIIPLTRHLSNLVQILGLPAHPLDQTPDHLWGNYSAGEIRTFADEAARLLNGREVPHIYIAVDKAANAMAVNSMLINFIPRLNAIYLNSYLLKALNPMELKAILAHELAHFHRFMSPLTRNMWVSMIGEAALLMVLFSVVPELSMMTWAVVCVLYWSWAPFTILYGLVDLLTTRDLEFCADLVAARLAGCLNMINALLKIGDRAEVYEAVEDRVTVLLERDATLNAAEAIQQLIDRLPEVQIDIRRAKRLFRQKPGDNSTQTEGDRKENRKLLKKLVQRRQLRKALRVLHWNRFDVIHRDGSLDARELEKYLGALVNSPLHATHHLSTDHPDQEPYQTHPSMKKRILYLYLHCLKPSA